VRAADRLDVRAADEAMSSSVSRAPELSSMTTIASDASTLDIIIVMTVVK
jgi:hypothetical protein